MLNFEEISLTVIFKYLLISFIAFLTPLQWLILGVGSLIIIDTIIGVYKSYKLGQKINSKRFGHIITKFLLYDLAVISGYILELMLGGVIPISRVVAVGIGCTEMFSISENINELTGISIWKFIKNALTRNQEISDEQLTKIENEVKTNKKKK